MLSPEELEFVAVDRQFVDAEVRPVVHNLEASNTYPEALIEGMKSWGIYDPAIPEPWGERTVAPWGRVVTGGDRVRSGLRAPDRCRPGGLKWTSDAAKQLHGPSARG